MYSVQIIIIFLLTIFVKHQFINKIYADDASYLALPEGRSTNPVICGYCNTL